MNGKQGQIAIVLILGAALLIYGGATGRLADAWRGLTGGGSSTPPPSSKDQPGDALVEEDGDSGTGGNVKRGPVASNGPKVSDISSLNNAGQMTTRGGGIL